MGKCYRGFHSARDEARVWNDNACIRLDARSLALQSPRERSQEVPLLGRAVLMDRECRCRKLQEALDTVAIIRLVQEDLSAQLACLLVDVSAPWQTSWVRSGHVETLAHRSEPRSKAHQSRFKWKALSLCTSIHHSRELRLTAISADSCSRR